MKKEVFILVAFLDNGDDWDIGFFDSVEESCFFLMSLSSYCDRLVDHYEIRSIDIDLLPGESLRDAFLRYDKELYDDDPDLYMERLYRLYGDVDDFSV